MATRNVRTQCPTNQNRTRILDTYSPSISANTFSFADWSREIAKQTEDALAELLTASSVRPQRLHDAMRYATLGGGKRVRAMLVYGAGQLVGADPSRLRVIASSVEMLHAYSLVHDDLPCMDDDVLRRGKPTCHVEFDEATAMLAGDALQARALEILAEYTVCDYPKQQLELIHLFSHAIGSRGMCGGQAIDLANTGKAIDQTELEYMHILKTGALIRASVLMGAMAGSELSPVMRDKLDHYAKCIGLAFQVVDDVLDEAAPTETLGKTAGKDKEAGKTTYISLLGINRARNFAQELIDDAIASLDAAVQAGHTSTTAGEPLKALARYIVERSY
jgi:farnesyl diphosphate synthase